MKKSYVLVGLGIAAAGIFAVRGAGRAAAQAPLTFLSFVKATCTSTVPSTSCSRVPFLLEFPK